MISRILVPLDGSHEAEQAIPYAQKLLPDGGALLLFTAVPDLTQNATREPALTELNWALNPTSDVPSLSDSEAVRAALHRSVERAADSRLKWFVRVSSGDPATEILREIEQDRVDLVAMTTHGRGAVDRATFGSVADRVTRTSPVPVLLVRPDRSETLSDTGEVSRILVPLDGSDLAEEALPIAVELARRLAVSVHLVRATNAASVLASLGGGSFFPVSPPQDVYDQLNQDLETGARAYLEGVALRLQDQKVDVTWAVLEGSPYFEIAREIQAHDLVILTSHGRGGVMRWLVGSVAEKLVREAPVPVLLVPATQRGNSEKFTGGSCMSYATGAGCRASESPYLSTTNRHG